MLSVVLFLALGAMAAALITHGGPIAGRSHLARRGSRSHVVRSAKSKAKSSRRASPTAGGFGGKAAEPARTAPRFAPEAQRLLDRHGSLAAAQHAYFKAGLVNASTAEPAVYDAIVEQQRAGEVHSGAAHAKLVECTWDAVAAFNSKGATISRDLKERLARIAAAAVPADAAAAATTLVLDVGCGDGGLVPSLVSAAGPALEYVGVDVSGLMVEAARAKHPALAFE